MTSTDQLAPALDVRLCARELAVQPKQLVVQLLKDKVPVTKISDRVWRVRPEDWERWKRARELAAIHDTTQDTRRADFVKKGPKRRPKFRR